MLIFELDFIFYVGLHTFLLQLELNDDLEAELSFIVEFLLNLNKDSLGSLEFFLFLLISYSFRLSLLAKSIPDNSAPQLHSSQYTINHPLKNCQ